jgi:recombination protein RecA
MVTKAEIDGDMGDMHVGQLARLMSQAMRKLTSVIAKSNCVAIFINQVREKIGIVYGNPETTPGGRALKFYASVRMEVRKGEAIKSGGEIIGNRTRVKIVKNKVSPPFKECEFDIMYGKGISRTGEVLDLAVDLNIVQKGGAWFSYNGVKLGQGRDNAKETLRSNPDMMKEIEEKIKEQASNLVMVSKKNKKMAMLEQAKKSTEEETTEPNSVPTTDFKPEGEDNFEEFTPADGKQ